MKMAPQTYNKLREAITVYDSLIPEATMRQRWDALWRAVDAKRIDYSELRDLNDAHIDTALRAIARGE